MPSYDELIGWIALGAILGAAHARVTYASNFSRNLRGQNQDLYRLRHHLIDQRYVWVAASLNAVFYIGMFLLLVASGFTFLSHFFPNPEQDLSFYEATAFFVGAFCAEKLVSRYLAKVRSGPLLDQIILRLSRRSRAGLITAGEMSDILVPLLNAGQIHCPESKLLQRLTGDRNLRPDQVIETLIVSERETV